MVVLSHDPYFLKLVWDELPKDHRKALRLQSVGTTTALGEWDIYEHLKAVFQVNMDALQRYIDRSDGKPRDITQKLRPTLEGYCKGICLGQFGDNLMMGEIIKTIRDSGATCSRAGSSSIERAKESGPP